MNTISSLGPADLPTAFQIEKRVHVFPWSEKAFVSSQGDRYLNFQLKVDDVMAAFAITQVIPDEAALPNTAANPGFQRRGLRCELLEHLIDELGKYGISTLWFGVYASNMAVIVLYESLGFNEATICRNYYPMADGREDATIMTLPISM